MEVTQIDRGSFTESCSSTDESVRVVFDGTCVCDIMQSTGKTRTKYELRLYADYATAMADIANEGWTYGTRAQAHLEREGLL
jgi:hypothetical protein